MRSLVEKLRRLGQEKMIFFLLVRGPGGPPRGSGVMGSCISTCFPWRVENIVGDLGRNEGLLFVPIVHACAWKTEETKRQFMHGMRCAILAVWQERQIFH